MTISTRTTSNGRVIHSSTDFIDMMPMLSQEIIDIVAYLTPFVRFNSFRLVEGKFMDATAMYLEPGTKAVELVVSKHLYDPNDKWADDMTQVFVETRTKPEYAGAEAWKTTRIRTTRGHMTHFSAGDYYALRELVKLFRENAEIKEEAESMWPDL